MDIQDYFADPNPDKNEWIKRSILTKKWELRRTIEELEFTAEKYQIAKKHDESETKDLSVELKNLLERSYDLANQIRNLS